MTGEFDRLTALAESTVEGVDANRALWDARTELEKKYTNVVMYEMVPEEGIAWGAFLRAQLPKLTEHLFAKGIPMLGGPNVVLSVWRGSKLFIFGAGAFFDAICTVEGISHDELWIRISRWRIEAGLSAGPLALSPPVRNSDPKS
jgi:hypothetical protein